MTRALSWGVIGVVVPALLALAAGFVLAGDTMADFNIGHVCFLLAFLLLGAKIIHLGVGSHKVMSYLLVFVGCGIIGVIALAVTHYVEQKRDSKIKTAAEAKQAKSNAAQPQSQPQATETTQPITAHVPTLNPEARPGQAVVPLTTQPLPKIEIVYEPRPPYFISPPPRGQDAGEVSPPEVIEVNIGIRNTAGIDIPDLRVEIENIVSEKTLVNVPLRRLHETPPYKHEYMFRAGDREMMFGLLRMTTGTSRYSLYSSSPDVPESIPARGGIFEIAVSGSGIQTEKKKLIIKMERYGMLSVWQWSP